MNFIARLLLAGALGWCFFLMPIVGCQKSTVEAVPRTPKSKPVFGTVEFANGDSSSVKINFDFVHPDHFACLGCRVQQVVSRSELDDVPWDVLEEHLAGLVGKANADLSLIERVWLLLDRESVFSAMEGNADGGWFVAVIQYKTSPIVAQLPPAGLHVDKEEGRDETVPGSDAAADDKAGQLLSRQSRLVAKPIGEKMIAIGSVAMVSKMKSAPAETSGLSRLLRQSDFSSDVEGVIATAPVRETLKTVFGMAAQFGGKEAKKLKTLPDVLGQIEIKVSLDQNDTDLLSLKATIDDKRMIEEVVRASQRVINPPVGSGAASNSSVTENIGRAVQSSGRSEGLASQKVLEEVSREIKEKKLFSVDSDDGSVSFRLRRPTKIAELVRAMVADFKPKAAEGPDSKPDEISKR